MMFNIYKPIYDVVGEAEWNDVYAKEARYLTYDEVGVDLAYIRSVDLLIC